MNRLVRSCRRPLLVLVCACAHAVGADEAGTRDFFAALAGEWQGAGEVLGRASLQRARWEPALDAAFFRFAFDSRVTDAQGKETRFLAEAFYQVAPDGTVTGTWLDSRGMTLALSGGLDESGSLVVLWGSPETEHGRSTYRLDSDTLVITDEVVAEDGAWRIFGRTRLTRRQH